MKKIIFSLICFSLSLTISTAQYTQFSLQEKVNQSELILEGTVVKKYAYKKDGLIYTANIINVCEVIYNSNSSSEVITEVIVMTFGGNLDGEFNSWNHVLTLHIGMEGLFFLKSNSDITPENTPIDNYYYQVYGQEQGFIAYYKDDLWDFAGQGFFTDIVNANDYINQINNASNQNFVTESCLLDKKSGVVLRVDTTYLEQEDIIIQTSIKGQWSKKYDLESIKIQFEFTAPVDLSLYNFSTTSISSTLSNNYTLSWIQPNSQSAELTVLKNSGSFQFSEINALFSDFLEISFHNSLLFEGIASIQVIESSYKKNGETIDFIEHELVNNKFVQRYLPAPDMKTFEPKEVCAGIKADQSVGTPIIDGYIIIKGDNFGDIVDPANSALIPSQYRVEFLREEETSALNAFKVTPLPADYEYWTNTEIKIKVPSAGYLVNNNNIISDNPEPSNAITGRITVRTPDGYDYTPQDQIEDKLIVKFTQFNDVTTIENVLQSFPKKLIAKEGNGGYYFVFDSSFDNIYISNPSEARQDVIDAFCEWNMITDAKLEIVPTCPDGVVCSKIKYADIPSTGSGTVSLAWGASNSNTNFTCPEEAVVHSMLLVFNNQITDWRPSSEASFSTHIIKTATFHEIGHLLQLGHVYNNDALMYPLYDHNSPIDIDAVAGGTHVSFISSIMSCSAALNLGAISNCMTPTFDIAKESWVKLTPNPVEGYLTLSFEKTTSKAEFEIYDVLGRLKKKGLVSFDKSLIDVSYFIAGTYFLVLKDDKTSFLIKFSKK